MRRFKPALISLSILFVLGGIATWDEWKTKEEEAENKRKNRISHRIWSDVIGFEYILNSDEKSSAGDSTTSKVELKVLKEGDSWKVVSPISSLADGGVVEGLLKSVFEYSFTKTVGHSKESWADFGLVNPSVVVKFLFKDNSPPFVVSLGQKAPVGYNLYLRTNNSDTVLLGSQYLLTALTKSLFDFRDKKIAYIDVNAIEALSYQLKGEDKIDFSRKPDGFNFSGSHHFEADDAAVRGFIDNLNAIRAIAFLDNPDPTISELFRNPYVKIEWTNAKGFNQSLSVVVSGQKTYATLDSTQLIVEISSDGRDKIERKLEDFRNRRVLKFDATEVSEVQIDGKIFKNVNGDWIAAEAQGESASNKVPHIRALLIDMQFGKASKFIEPLQAHAILNQAPESKLVLRFKDNSKEAMTLELFKSPDNVNSYIVRKSGDATLYEMPTSVFASSKASSDNSEVKSDDEAPGSLEPIYNEASPAGEMPLDEVSES